MKHPIDLVKLINFLAGQGFSLSVQQQELIQQYLDLLQSWAERQNLLSRGDLDHIPERHFLPVFYLARLIQPTGVRRILDVGAGAGFSGILLSILYSQVHVTLIDSSRKKYLFLREACETVAPGCELKNIRVETLRDGPAPGYDIALCRAVGTLVHLWGWVQPLLSSSGSLYIIKGGNLRPETDRVQNLHNVKTEILEIPAPWKQFSQYLGSKKIVQMRSRND